MADLSGLNILVTGGTGSFGRAFCERIIDHAASITVYSRDEFKQSEMAAALESDRLRFIVGDIRDLARLTDAMEGIDVVVHAAAMKQVPTCEENPTEAIQSNVIGSCNVIAAAIAAEVSCVVALSTDKAASPTNTYGATKMLADRLFLSAPKGRTRFCIVRCGNIFGSRGSVVPLFIEQARRGAPITLTDASMTRYSIMPAQAIDMVVTAILTAQGGEMFIPKMPCYVLADVVNALAPRCEVREIGPRAGERPHECLITEAEASDARDMGTHWIVQRGHGDGSVQATYSNRYNDWLTPEAIRIMAEFNT